jgi:REP element-mobilizing transposase RayT
MARGIDGKKIFLDRNDFKEFLFRLRNGIKECGYRCLAWCLMENHYHLLVRSSERPMSALMRPLNGGYARWFNAKYDRRGYLFQDRYKSVLCQDQEYAKQLIRYIHLNPVRSGLVGSLDKLKDWPWCGHGFLLGFKQAEGRDFQDRRESLRRFGNTEKNAIKEYMKYLSEGINETDMDHAGILPNVGSYEVAGSEKGWPAVIGDPDFARKAMERHSIGFHRKHRKADYAHVLENLAVKACSECHLERDELSKRGRGDKHTRTRALFCYSACKDELLPLSTVAQFLHITIPGVSKLIRKEIAEREKFA